MTRFETVCAAHGHAVSDPRAVACPVCASELTFRYQPGSWDAEPAGEGMWRQRAWLPLADGHEPVTLGEGATALVPAAARPAHDGLRVLEARALNPSGSHKDRALSVAVSVAKANGASTVFVASAGSTGLAAAAYAARAGLRCVVLVGADASERRVLPLRLAGATVMRAGGNVDDALDLIGELAGPTVWSTSRRAGPGTPGRPRDRRRSPTSSPMSCRNRPRSSSCRSAAVARSRASVAGSRSCARAVRSTVRRGSSGPNRQATKRSLGRLPMA